MYNICKCLSLPVLSKQVLSNQAAFVPSRSIMDNALFAFEILHQMKCKRKGKIGEVSLLLEISKTFDSVSWSYLLAVMAKIGFCEQWVLSMKMCITSVNYHV